jgi:hypothetical protein|tara:strand:+ start:432 stop:587 length:156 start_codon:yes stop_codon:yes gene_type:complete
MSKKPMTRFQRRLKNSEDIMKKKYNMTDEDIIDFDQVFWNTIGRKFYNNKK